MLLQETDSSLLLGDSGSRLSRPHSGGGDSDLRQLRADLSHPQDDGPEARQWQAAVLAHSPSPAPPRRSTNEDIKLSLL